MVAGQVHPWNSQKTINKTYCTVPLCHLVFSTTAGRDGWLCGDYVERLLSWFRSRNRVKVALLSHVERRLFPIILEQGSWRRGRRRESAYVWFAMSLPLPRTGPAAVQNCQKTRHPPRSTKPQRSAIIHVLTPSALLGK